MVEGKHPSIHPSALGLRAKCCARWEAGQRLALAASRPVAPLRSGVDV